MPTGDPGAERLGAPVREPPITCERPASLTCTPPGTRSTTRESTAGAHRCRGMPPHDPQGGVPCPTIFTPNLGGTAPRRDRTAHGAPGQARLSCGLPGRSSAGCSGFTSRVITVCRLPAPRSSLPTTCRSSITSRSVVAVRRRLSFVGKVEYLDTWRTRRVLPALGMIPVDRDSPRRAWGALERAAGVLEDDELFAIYPEGTRSRDGALQAGHTGVGHLSATTGVAIIPTGIVGTDAHPAFPAPDCRARSRRPSYASVPPSILPPTRAPAVSDGDGSPVT